MTSRYTFSIHCIDQSLQIVEVKLISPELVRANERHFNLIFSYHCFSAFGISETVDARLLAPRTDCLARFSVNLTVFINFSCKYIERIPYLPQLCPCPEEFLQRGQATFKAL